LRSIGINAVYYNLSGAQLHGFTRPFDGVYPRSASTISPGMSKHFPAKGTGTGNPLGIHAQDNTLVTKSFGAFRNKVRILHCGRIYGNLVSTGVQH
jgi:hypothetical protein